MRLKNPRNIVNRKVNEALITTKSRFFLHKNLLFMLIQLIWQIRKLSPPAQGRCTVLHVNFDASRSSIYPRLFRHNATHRGIVLHYTSTD